MSNQIIIRDLRLMASIGIHPHERTQRQPLLFNLAVQVPPYAGAENIEDVVCYETIVRHIDAVLAVGHIDLVEQLAEQIIATLFADPRISHIALRIEKPDAIAEAAAIGISIERAR